MTSRKFFAVLAFLLCWSHADAQFFKNVDEWLRERQARQRYDTTYYFRPQERWLVRGRSFVSGQHSGMVVGTEKDVSLIDLDCGPQFRQSFGLGYRNVILDVGFNPFKNNRLLEISLAALGNRLGFNGNFSIAGGMSGRADINNEAVVIPVNTMAGLRGKLELCYAFNGGRFSMPAARIQTYVQRKSAGSLLALASAQIYGVTTLKDAPVELPVHNAITGLIGLGLGYGYNWVPSGHWLIHASLTETIGIFGDSRLGLVDEVVTFSEKVPVSATAGNLAVCYYFKKFYVGVSGSFDSLVHIAVGDAGLINGYSSYQGVFSAGVRF